MSITVREFRRRDRDQLTALVNLHIAAVIPGVGLSTNVVLSQLEREPAELIVDPWVEHRECLVAVENDAVVAATLLHRFRGEDAVRDGYRSAADIRWLLFTPQARKAGEELLAAALDCMISWSPSHIYGDVSLPVPGCLGIPESWPHVRELYIQAGFSGPARTETTLAARCHDLLGHDLGGAHVRRTVGVLGARFDLMRDGSTIGYVEVGECSAALARSTTASTWTDVGNLFANDPLDLPTVMPALFSAAAEWLLLGGVERLIDYYAPDVDEPDYLDTLLDIGFQVMSVNERGWEYPLTGRQ